MGLEVKFKVENGVLPTRGYVNDSGWDLTTSEQVLIPARGFKDIPTGVSMAMPEPLWALMTGRSSAGRKYGVRIEQGVIDNGYTGELFVGVWNLADHDIVIPAGTRLGQLIFFKRTDVTIKEYDSLPKTARGSNGFGSTG